MKKLVLFLCSLLLVFGMSEVAGATTYTFEPSGLGTLDSQHWYTWGINQTIPEGETIQSATLSFRYIDSYDPYNDILWVDLLDSATAGTTVVWGSDYGDHFAALGGTPLFNYLESRDGNSYTYGFTESQIGLLGNYISYDGNYGFGFDPDCYFYTSGVSFTVETAGAPVPEPTTMLLLGGGLAGLGFMRRKKAEIG